MCLAVFASAVAVGSGADVVDQRIVARGDISADGGEIGLFAADIRDDQARIEELGFGRTDGAASGIWGPELRTGLRADVGRSDVAAQYLRGPVAGTDSPASMIRGEASGGEGGCGGAGDGGAGAAMMAAGSRADVDRPGSGWQAGFGYPAWVRYTCGRAEAMPQAVAEEGLQSSAEFWGAAPDHGAAPGALIPEFWADVAWMGGPTDRSAGMTGGEAVGGEDDCGGADGGDAGAAMMATGSRVDVMAAGSRAALTVLRAMRARCQTEGVVFSRRSMGSERQQNGVGCGGDDGRAKVPSCFLGPAPNRVTGVSSTAFARHGGHRSVGLDRRVGSTGFGNGFAGGDRVSGCGARSGRCAMGAESRVSGGCGERRQEEEGRAGGAVSTAVGWDGSGMGSTAAADDGGRRRRSMLRADGGFWRMGLDGSGQLLAREGQEDTRREEGSGGGRATADGDGRRR